VGTCDPPTCQSKRALLQSPGTIMIEDRFSFSFLAVRPARGRAAFFFLDTLRPLRLQVIEEGPNFRSAPRDTPATDADRFGSLAIADPLPPSGPGDRDKGGDAALLVTHNLGQAQ